MPLQLVLAKRPTGNIIPGETFNLVNIPTPSVKDIPDRHVLVEALYFSVDPAMRGWLDDRRSYIPPVKIGEVMRSLTVSRVLAVASGVTKFQPGDIVTCMLGIQEVGILPESQVDKAFPIAPGSGLKLSDLLGVLGITGLTAYFGMEKIGKVKPGDTVVVSAAAGATGSVAAQLAKLAGAKRVIGIAGGKEKCRLLKEELGLDEALDYKANDFRQKFKEATPDYVDVFFDNVGGEILDLMLSRANAFARFVICGGISQYNNSTHQGPGKYFFNVITQRVRMEGFIVMDYMKEWPEATAKLAKWVSEGKLKRKETLVKGGIKAAEGALQLLFEGKNVGKVVVEVKGPEDPVAKL
ncbi:putative NADP-dependent oxidoreductase [Podospora fimiseda]|uniref:Dehydrogenase FUB6 n=1 Tax=Podospora fimiseda TaxID=252190 RepID=A0AAN7BFE7_9PEZI|nr:putative NADP-dependent oxidoreductase [Podospora fimiseda]